MNKGLSNGFSAIELLISIILAVVLLGGGYQLYNTALKSSASARMRYKANNIAYEYLRQSDNLLQTPCAAATSTPTNNPQMEQLPNSSVVINITCPMTSEPEMSMITVTVNYQDSGAKSVQRSILK